MHGARLAVAALVCACACVVLAASARAAVRVDRDEVIFSLHAPDANEVYLIGDFNQWNPTVEPMNRVDDHFEIGLFLVAGTYRYKFVVDGRTIVDPDNPGRSPEKGSPLSLVERSGGLILSTELADEAAPAARAEFSGRYIGRFTDDDGNNDHAQRVDGFVMASLDHLRARAVVATHDSSWSWSPAKIDAFFDRGFVDVTSGRLALRGFENDTTWASSDPMNLVGNAGVFGYDAGFRRHGFAASATSSAAALRAMYADMTGRGSSSPGSWIGTGSVSREGNVTTVYVIDPTTNGSDVIAIDGRVPLGSAAAGYAFRGERGLNPGTVARVERDGPALITTHYATRENRNASSLWLSYDLPRSLRITGSYGWGAATAHAYDVAVDTMVTPPLRASGPREALDETFSISGTDRGVVSLATNGNGTNASLRWDYTRFDFDGVAGRDRAEVHRARFAADGTLGGWIWNGALEYTHARYGNTPDDLSINWPDQNVWLSLWDNFDGERLAAVQLPVYAVYRASAKRDGASVGGTLSAALVTEELARSLAHANVRGDLEWSIRGPWRAQADGRAAWYDGARWFGALYFEAGYRTRWLDANLGFGFDPDAFDPVINDYASTARVRELRGALDNGFARSRAADILAGVRARERAMEQSRAIKVEIVVRLP